MTSRDFCYWLQGFFEIAGAASHDGALTTSQVCMIERHLKLVFKHEIDPSIDKGKEELKKTLDFMHGGLGKVRC
jgi:hypothetical protein